MNVSRTPLWALPNQSLRATRMFYRFTSHKMSGTGRNKSENITASKMIRFFAAFELKRGF